MIGKYQVQLGADQLISGMASSDYATDGALGTSSNGLNPFLKPGIMRALAAPTTVTSPIAGNIIASAEDSPGSSVVSSNNRTMVDDTGRYYLIAGSTVTLKKTGAATTKYVSGKTDQIAYIGNTYTSLTDDISIFNTAANTFTESWWVGTKAQPALINTVPHPMEVYQGNMYIADGNEIHTNNNGTITLGTLTLNGNEVIYALGIDPATGLLLVSVSTLINASDTLSARFFVYLWDGISLKPTRKIPVDDLITAFYNVGGTVYIGQGLTIGQWNGNGVTFLRKLQNASFSGPETYVDLPYKHHFSNTRNVLHVIDGTKVLSYGEVIAGRKGFFYTAYNSTGTHNLSCIMSLGGYRLAIAYATTSLDIYDFTAAGAGNGDLYFNNVYFPRPITIRRVRAITTRVTASTTTGALTLTDENNTGYVTGSNGYYVSGTSGQYVFDFDFSSLKLQGLQIRNNFMNNYALELIRLIVYYDIAE